MAISLIRQKNTENGLRIFRQSEEAEQMAKLLYTLFFGFFAGILGMILKQESLLYHTGFLDSYTLGPVKYLEPDTGKLLTAVLMQRLGMAVAYSSGNDLSGRRSGVFLSGVERSGNRDFNCWQHDTLRRERDTFSSGESAAAAAYSDSGISDVVIKML